MNFTRKIIFGCLGIGLAGSALAGGAVASGSNDLSFGTKGAVVSNFSGAARSVNLQSDGKIVVFGSEDKITSEDRLVRYNTDGTLDNSFGNGGIVITGDFFGMYGWLKSAIQADGKIIIVGPEQIKTGTFRMERYNSNGTLDTTFGVNGVAIPNFGAYGANAGPYDVPYAIKLQADGKILVGGQVATNQVYYSGGVLGGTLTYAGGFLARFNSNGSADTTFASNGVVINPANSDSTNNSINGLAIQTNGQIVTGGYKPTLARYNANGSLDTAFGTNGQVFDPRFDISATSPNSTLIDSNGRITSAIRGYLIRYNSNGTPDSTFGTSGAVSISTPNQLNAIAFQNGKIVTGGTEFTQTYNSRRDTWTTTRAYTLSRHLTSGALDTTFGTAGVVTTPLNNNENLFDVVVQGDNKIVAVGTTDIDPSTSGVASRFVVTRYNP